MVVRGGDQGDLLTNQAGRAALPLHPEDGAAHDGLVGLKAERNRDAGLSGHAQVRDGNKAGGTQISGPSSCGCGCCRCCRQNSEGIGGGGGGLLPLD